MTSSDRLLSNDDRSYGVAGKSVKRGRGRVLYDRLVLARLVLRMQPVKTSSLTGTFLFDRCDDALADARGKKTA